MNDKLNTLQKTVRHPKVGMDLLKIEKPDLSKSNKGEVLNKLDNNKNLWMHIKNANEPDYLYWTKIKYKIPPAGLTNIEFWVVLKQIRQLLSILTPIKAENGNFFTWVKTPIVDEYLHKIDMYTGGQIFAPYETIMGQTKQKFVSRGIIEEAIASSQLEGATTTSTVAKKLILENKTPRNKSEIMITNNYRAMKLIDEEYKNKDITEELLFKIHRQLTKDQVAGDEQFRYRNNGDDIIVGNDTHIAHIPPKEDFLKKIEVELKNSKNSHHTIRNYLMYNSKLLEFFGKNPDEISEDDVKSYISENLSSRASSSIILFLSAIKYSYSNIFERDITVKIKRPKKEKKIPVVLTKDEVKKILNVLSAEKSKLDILDVCMRHACF